MNKTTKDAVTLVAAANAFNNIYKEVLFHSINILCSIVSTYVLICFSIPACVFIIGEKELLLPEGTE